MKQYITFHKDRRFDAPDPIPSASHLPDWFQALELSIESLPIPSDKTAKLCMPLSDAMKSGWLLRAPCDLHIRKDDDGLDISAEKKGAAVGLSPDQADRDNNSSFLFPECLVSSAHGVDSPAGYSTLVTQPLNRDEMRFTVPGMVVPTDEYDGTIQVPMYIETDAVQIEAGEPIAQVVPIAREDLSIETTTRSFKSGSKFETMLHKTLRASSRRKDVYRKDSWVPKPSTRVVEDPAEPAGDTGTATRKQPASKDSMTGDRHGNDGTLAYYCSEERDGDLPAPAPATEHVPEWYSRRLSSIDGLDSNQPTSEWIDAATSIGAIVPLPTRTSMQRTGGNQPLDVTTETEREPHQVQFAKKMGDAHPLMPASVVNLTTEWLIRPPSGYSVMVCSPFAHLQRYYRSYAGLADFDRYATTANTPGLFTERVDEWTFPAQTPVSQHIPINRENIISVATIEQ